MIKRSIVLPAAIGTVLVLGSCGDSSTGVTEPPQPAGIEAVSELELAGGPGQTLGSPLTVRVVDRTGAPVPGVVVGWSVTDGTLSSTSVVTDEAGEAAVEWTLCETVGSYQAQATVGQLAPVTFAATVLADRPATVEVIEGEVVFDAIGESHQLQVDSITDGYGNEVTGVTVGWSSADTAVATVDASGLVQATGAGSTVITATADTASTTVAVTVAQVVTDVSVSPASHSLIVGDTVRLRPTATDANGYTVEDADFTFSSSDTTVARVDSAGVVTGAGGGFAVVTAASGGYSDYSAITVAGACAPRGTAALGQTVAGTLSTQDCEVASGVFAEPWVLELAEDTVVVLDMTGTGLDPYVLVTNTNGDAIAGNDNAPATTDAHLEVPLSAGTYVVYAMDVSGGSGDYSLAVAGGTTPVCTLTGSVAVGDSADAALDSADCLLPNGARADMWELTVDADATVQVDMRSDAVDAYLVVFNGSGGTVLAQNDDGGGGTNGTDARVTATLTVGTYLVMATTYGGGERGSYTLSTSGTTPCLVGAVSPGDTVSGTLGADDCRFDVDDSYLEAWSLDLSQQTTVRIDMRSTQLDAYLFVSDTATATVLGEDDNTGGGANGTDARVSLTLDAGRYLVWANTWPGESGDYELSVAEVAAALAFSVDSAEAGAGRAGPGLGVHASAIRDTGTGDPITADAKPSTTIRLPSPQLSTIRLPREH